MRAAAAVAEVVVVRPNPSLFVPSYNTQLVGYRGGGGGGGYGGGE
jgi:hypothetical protein